MQYNEIGKTGMKVSNLGFGASSLGGVFHARSSHIDTSSRHDANVQIYGTRGHGVVDVFG
ncbi:MAG: hypothetical protein Q4D64_12455 [Prevotellaceae bacterium]|nr:hypothetical protein [Prevotellaceae bacterium]